jgi:glycosyltransferase involved in cell wall biosynthesis
MKVLVAIPVYNEAGQLGDSVREVHGFLGAQARFDWEILIVNNGSTDGTLAIARGLTRDLPGVRVFHLDQKGRGGALSQAWAQRAADILTYMDVDLSTEIEAFPRLVEPLLSGACDLATGSRLLRESRTTRCLRRDLLSHGYNWLVRACFHTQFSDAQCGFKAITRRAARELLPLVHDTGWFWDTELLVIAEKLGYRIFDLPVRWVEDRDSRVKVWSTVIHDLRGIIRLRRRLASPCLAGRTATCAPGGQPSAQTQP